VVKDWEKKLQNDIKDLDPEDVYNFDESALFYRLLPNKTYAFANDSRFGGKQLKNRITIAFICNASGSDRQAIMIGSSIKPRAFNGVNPLPINYYNQKNAWINADIFNNILKKFDKKMKKDNRNVVLYMDSCPAHRVDIDLSNVTVKFLPKNSTSVLQVIYICITKFNNIYMLIFYLATRSGNYS
jgi:hypothetical protein